MIGLAIMSGAALASTVGLNNNGTQDSWCFNPQIPKWNFVQSENVEVHIARNVPAEVRRKLKKVSIVNRNIPRKDRYFQYYARAGAITSEGNESGNHELKWTTFRVHYDAAHKSAVVGSITSLTSQGEERNLIVKLRSPFPIEKIYVGCYAYH